MAEGTQENGNLSQPTDMSPVYKEGGFCKRNRHAFITIAITIALIILTLVVGLYLAQRKKGCPDLNEQPHQSASSTERSFGTEVTVTCDTGFWTASKKPSAKVICEDTGEWGLDNGPQYCQAIQCPDLSGRSHMQLSGEGRGISSHVTVTCDRGYRMPDGSASLDVTCTESGDWDNAMMAEEDLCT